MSAETYSWPEGAIYLWTGTATASAVPGYAQNLQLTETWGWENYWTISGQARDTLTGKRFDLQIGGLVTYDTALTTLIESQTAIHIHVRHEALGLSGGRFLYSGRIDQYMVAGREGDGFQYSITYHCNEWTAYG